MKFSIQKMILGGTCLARREMRPDKAKYGSPCIEDFLVEVSFK
jgi:hypothetical protein